MPWFKIFLTIGSLILFGLIVCQTLKLPDGQRTSIIRYQLSDRETVRHIAEKWSTTGQLHAVWSIARTSLIFVPFYILLIINFASRQVLLEKHVVWNGLARLLMLVIVLVGFLDVRGNVCLLRDVYKKGFLCSPIVSIAMWIMWLGIGSVVVCLLGRRVLK